MMSTPHRNAAEKMAYSAMRSGQSIRECWRGIETVEVDITHGDEGPGSYTRHRLPITEELLIAAEEVANG